VLRKDAHELRQKIKLIGLLSGGEQQRSLETTMQKDASMMNDLLKELKLQDIQINELQKQIQDLEEQNEMLRAQRPRVNKLPPIEHHSQRQAPQPQYEEAEESSPMKAHEDAMEQEEEESPPQDQPDLR
jgi:hypothetical protein